MSTSCCIVCYGMKNRAAIFQFPFIAESGFSSWGKWKIIRLRFVFRSQPNDFSISGKRFFVLRRTRWSLAERCLKHPSGRNLLIINRLSCDLIDEGCFSENSCMGRGGCFFISVGDMARPVIFLWREPRFLLFLYYLCPTFRPCRKEKHSDGI